MIGFSYIQVEVAGHLDSDRSSLEFDSKGLTRLPSPIFLPSPRFLKAQVALLSFLLWPQGSRLHFFCLKSCCSNLWGCTLQCLIIKWGSAFPALLHAASLLLLLNMCRKSSSRVGRLQILKPDHLCMPGSCSGWGN